MGGGADPLPHDAAPTVSVVVAVYNAERTVGECVDSLLRMDYPRERLEIVCVDNASTDRTPGILAAYGERCRVLREPKRGPAAARNAGIRSASGTVVAFTDADCTVDREWLFRLVGRTADPTIGVVGGRVLSRRPCNAIEAFGERIHDHQRALERTMPPYAMTGNWASRRDLLLGFGGFNEDLLRCSDVDLSYRIVAAGYALVYEPDAVIYHRHERTPWGLLHEGYVHGFHAARVLELHAEFLEPARIRALAALRAKVEPPAGADAPPPWHERALRSLFDLGKKIGRRHASWIAAERRPA